MDSIIVLRLLDVLLSQPLHMFIMAIIVTILTGVFKTCFKFIKKVEITYFIPYVLGILTIVIYSLIMKIPLNVDTSQIIINGVYIALMSSIIFQLYKAIKDIGLKVLLKDIKTLKIYEELHLKLKNSLSAITYAKRISLIDKNDLTAMIETLRGSGIEERNLYSLANDLSIISKMQEKPKKCKDITKLIEVNEGEKKDD